MRAPGTDAGLSPRRLARPAVVGTHLCRPPSGALRRPRAALQPDVGRAAEAVFLHRPARHAAGCRRRRHRLVLSSATRGSSARLRRARRVGGRLRCGLAAAAAALSWRSADTCVHVPPPRRRPAPAAGASGRWTCDIPGTCHTRPRVGLLGSICGCHECMPSRAPRRLLTGLQRVIAYRGPPADRSVASSYAARPPPA